MTRCSSSSDWHQTLRQASCFAWQVQLRAAGASSACGTLKKRLTYSVVTGLSLLSERRAAPCRALNRHHSTASTLSLRRLFPLAANASEEAPRVWDNRMARSPVVEANDPEHSRDHGMFDWGLFGWFALLSSFSAILVILVLAAGH
jgi:hypothetical protein